MKEALKLALEAFETLTQYNMVRANIFRRFEPTCTGDYVDLREFREKAKPAITAIKEALAQPEQEPVATVVESQYEDGSPAGNLLGWSGRNEANDLPVGTKLYTDSPQRKPLTDEFLRKLHHIDQFRLFCDYDDFEQISRAIEAAHGIKE